MRVMGRGVTEGVATGSVALSLDQVSGSGPLVWFVKEFTPKVVQQVWDHPRVTAVVAAEGSITCHAANLLDELNSAGRRVVEAVVSTGFIADEEAVGLRARVEAGQGVVEVYGGEPADSSSVPRTASGDVTQRKKTEQIVDVVDGRQWVCYRPTYSYKPLDFDLLRVGMSRSPRVLLGRADCDVRLDEDGRFWIHGGVEPPEVVDRIEHDIDWFERKGREQDRVFDSLVDELEQSWIPALEHPDQASLRSCISGTSRQLITFYSYLPLTMATYEPLYERLVERLLLIGLAEPMALRYVRSVRGSAHSALAFRSGTFLDLEKWFVFPAPRPKIVRARIDFNRRASLEDHLRDALDRDLKADAGLRALARAAPLMFDLKEQKFYVAKAVMGVLNVALDIAAGRLVSGGSLKVREDVLQLGLDELLDSLGGLDPQPRPPRHGLEGGFSS